MKPLHRDNPALLAQAALSSPSLGYHAAPQSEQHWNYSLPPHKGVKMQLRTIGGICVLGTWYGDLGQYFLAWAPLLSNTVKE